MMPRGRERDLTLTGPEKRLLVVFAEGYSYMKAAELLGISRNAVLSMSQNLRAKLGAGSKEEAVEIARKRGELG